MARVNSLCCGVRWGARGGDGTTGRLVPVPLLRRVRGPAAADERWPWGALGRRGAEEEVPQTGYACVSIQSFFCKLEFYGYVIL
jgi:hypothetical protein